MLIGSLIRGYRKKKKMTLKSVAEKAGVSEGFLSQVENNVNSPSVDTLMKICKTIGVKPGDLLNQAGSSENLVVIRKSEWEVVDLPHTGFVTQRFFAPENRSVIDSAILVLEPNKSIPIRKNVKNGQELLCVLKGSLELFHAQETHILEQGDSVHFLANPKGQNITNNSNEITVALWVGTL